MEHDDQSLDEITLERFGRRFSAARRDGVCVRCGSDAVRYQDFSDDTYRLRFIALQMCESCIEVAENDPDLEVRDAVAQLGLPSADVEPEDLEALKRRDVKRRFDGLGRAGVAE